MHRVKGIGEAKGLGFFLRSMMIARRWLLTANQVVCHILANMQLNIPVLTFYFWTLKHRHDTNWVASTPKKRKNDWTRTEEQVPGQCCTASVILTLTSPPCFFHVAGWLSRWIHQYPRMQPIRLLRTRRREERDVAPP